MKRILSGVHKKESYKGFTLIELSIVLVVIGLLIGGILIGQSLIQSAKINRQIQQIQEIQVAIRAFKTKFNGLPGDTNKIGLTTGGSGPGNPNQICAGNSNGEINNGVTTPTGNEDWYGADPYYCNQYRAEWSRVFEHLHITGMYKWKAYDDSSGASFYPGEAYPKMILDDYEPKSLGNAGGVVVGYEPAVSYVKAGHKIRLGACYGSSGGPISGGGSRVTFYCGPSLTDIIALDNKLDDGKPMTGDVVVTSNYYFYRISGGLVGDATGCCIDSTTNSYRTSPNNSLTSQGNYIGLEVHTDF